MRVRVLLGAATLAATAGLAGAGAAAAAGPGTDASTATGVRAGSDPCARYADNEKHYDACRTAYASSSGTPGVG